MKPDNLLTRIYRKLKYNESLYVPTYREMPERLIDVVSAWKGNEAIIKDIINFTGIKTGKCLEFGVDNAYSTVAFSSYFDKVIGVDIFTGDIHSGTHSDNYDVLKNSVAQFPNIELIKADYKDFIAKNDNQHYDFIHVDIIHNYEDTYKCGLWAAQHADCVIFHDTVSFREVIRAVADISKTTGKRFYHFREMYGLGILCKQ